MRGNKFSASGVSPEVGQKQKTEKKKRERLNDGNNNGQVGIANAALGGARKAAWAKNISQLILKRNWLRLKLKGEFEIRMHAA